MATESERAMGVGSGAAGGFVEGFSFGRPEPKPDAGKPPKIRPRPKPPAKLLLRPPKAP